MKTKKEKDLVEIKSVKDFLVWGAPIWFVLLLGFCCILFEKVLTIAR